MTITRPRLAVLLGVLSLVALTGCGGGNGSATTAGSAAVGDMAAGKAAPRAAALPDGGSSGPADRGAGGRSQELVQQAVIKNGVISLRTPDPQQARDHVDLLLTRLHGSLDDEQTVYDKEGRIHDSHLVLRVPVSSFDTAMNDLEHLGTVVHSSSTGQDVTSQVIDVQQRLRTLRISLHDLNSFQRHAASIDQLLRFENAITQRRGQYQSLKAQRDHLLNQTSMSTITLDVAVPPTKVVPATHHRHAGFLTGLRHGWTALTDTVVVGLTALGAVLPFAVLLAAVGLPLWWWARRRAGTGPAAPAEAASGD